MESTLRLYDTVVKVLRQHENWLDRRHLCTLAWMIVGLIQSATVSLTAWVPYVKSRARYAQSTQRRFACWLALIEPGTQLESDNVILASFTTLILMGHWS